MNSTLSEVWHEVEKLLDDGISVIPVRDKDDGLNIAKSPYSTWKQFQTRRIEKHELWKDMEKFNTCAVGILGGKVSGNLYVIDIDVKYKPGIDAILFQDLKKLYPDIFEKVRIHKSPSGGFHILYRCENDVEGNLKLAGRPATEDELKKSKQKVYNFLETRGEGGYVLAPPSLGYKIVKNSPIPTLTLIEHQSIVNLCRSYNEIIKVDKPIKPTITEQSYYDENPFDDFNRRVDPTSLMIELGWSEFKSSNRFIWYTRPGKSKGISMSFNQEKRFFFCFTASSELEENHGYTPSNLVATVLFGGDKKRLHEYLVQRGYGKVKPKIEAKQVKQRVLCGLPLPANFSDEARQSAAEQAEALQEQHLYGIFWQQDEDGKIVIDREGIYRVAYGLGFRLYNEELLQIDDYKLFRRTDRHFYDTVKEYIKEEDGDVYNDICNSYEAFIQKNGTFTISRLPLLEDIIISDTDQYCYKFYNNCFIKITSEEITEHTYKELSGLIWDEKIQDRDYTKSAAKGKYVDFLKKSTSLNDNTKKAIGYLSHEYKDETTGYIIVLTEECPDPKMGGGSGKNIFSSLLKYSTTYTSTPGSQVKFDEKFLQSWNYEKVFAISDVPKNFDYGFLKELSTGVGKRKRLFKDEVNVPVELMPKFLIQTNFSYEVKDGGLRRRLIPIEFTNYFTNAGGVDVHYGCHFPKGWTQEDWNGYDAFIAECVQLWLASGMKLTHATLTTGGWIKQFDQSYGGLTREFIEENFEYWTKLRDGFISNKSFQDNYEKFCNENGINARYRLSSQLMNKALKDWSDKNKFVFEANVLLSVNGFKERGRQFLAESPF